MSLEAEEIFTARYVNNGSVSSSKRVPVGLKKVPQSGINNNSSHCKYGLGAGRGSKKDVLVIKNYNFGEEEQSG